MKETQFIEKYQKEWVQLEEYVDYAKLSTRKQSQAVLPSLSAEDFIKAYRRLCNQLALARTRNFSQGIIDRLHELAKLAHQIIYQKKNNPMARLWVILIRDFPVAVRREKKVMLWALVLFLFPAISMYFLSQIDSTWAYSIMSPYELMQVEEMYRPSTHERLGDSRNASSDVQMFGIYIWNNVSIGLRSFASGLVFCLGAIVSLVFNGAYFGVITGYLTEMGYANQTLYPFVIGHGSLELTAIIISCAAGIRLGLSFLFPKRLSRLNSVITCFNSLTPIVVGFTVMLVLAAFIEAFWSAIPMPITIKYGVGGILWGLVLFYFLFVGRRGSQSN